MQMVIIGAGASARVALDIIDDCIDAAQDYEALGYIVDARYGLPGTVINGKPILGGFDRLANHASQVRVICAVGHPVIRKRLIGRAEECGARFATIRHPSATLSRHAVKGYGCLIQAGGYLGPRVRLVDHVHLYTGYSVGHDCVIESYATPSSGVRLAGNATLSEGCFLSTGVSII